MNKHIKHLGITVTVVLGVPALSAGAFVYSGIYNIGADDHHTKPVFAILQTLRERSIQVRSEDLKMPNLNDPQRILQGAGQYAAMCTQCHLKPGMKHSELRPGLYPQPPNLSQTQVAPKEAFWIIKHGIKMSAMPAWGGSHDDPTIWSMVAFLQKLPAMTPAQYKEIVAKAPPDDDMDMGDEAGHSHSHGGAPNMTNMPMPGAASHSHNHATTHAHAPAAPTTSASEIPLSLQGMTPNAVPQAEAHVFQKTWQRCARTAAKCLI